MTQDDNAYAGVFFLGILLGLFLAIAARWYVDMATNDEKENVVKEYIQHPENFKVYHIKDDTIVVDIKVEYLK